MRNTKTFYPAVFRWLLSLPDSSHLFFGTFSFMEEIDILYQDENLIVVNKPIALPVHKNKNMPRDAPYLTKLLGQQLDGSVYNVHRLDAKTSGVILLALNPEMAHQLTQQFAAKTVEKVYIAIVKGIPGEGLFDRPVKKAKRGAKAPSRTHYRTLQTVNTQMEHKGADPQYLSLVELRPETGRWHQLRQHCSQERYDIIGDAQHGDWGLNHKLTDITGVKRLYLHAQRLTFTHPLTHESLSFETPVPKSFFNLLAYFEREG